MQLDQRLVQSLPPLPLGSDLLLDRQWSSSKALRMAQLLQQGHPLLCVTPDADQQSKMASELQFFCSQRELIYFPSWETLPSEPATPSVDIVGLRYRALSNLLQPSGTPPLVLATVQSLQQRTPSPERLRKLSLRLYPGLQIGLHAAAQQLLTMGYTKVDKVTEKGQIALRQGLIDLFPSHELEPVRIEWWGDQIDQLRTFDLSSQQARSELSQLQLLPALEQPFIDSHASILDYLPSPYTVVFDEVQAIEDRYVQIDGLPGAIHSGYAPFPQVFDQIQGTKVYMTHLAVDALSSQIARSSHSHLRIELFGRQLEAAHPPESLLRLHERFGISSSFVESLKLACDEGFELVLLYSSDAERAMAEQLDLPAQLVRGYLSESLLLETARLLVAPMAQYTHHERLYRPKLRISHSVVQRELLEISPGDHVVHLHHGIGIYRGSERRPDSQGQEQEYLCVEYAGGSKIFVPLESAYLLTRYQSLETEPHVELHQLGSTRWKKQWQSVQESIQGYAKQLLELYAKRQLLSSIPCPFEDSPLMGQFERDFPYDITEDQQLAIDAIKRDLAREQPMDRLVCGDVGYGKTEVAMRAAFKMIVDGKAQVAVLAPTTVLALQHFETFKQRMEAFGVEIAVLSRFTKARERAQILERLASGQIDLIVATHRLLNQEICFQRLGLLIVDEEQRFGVKAKEQLKMSKQGVNCLTLSATPIPRTLHIALMGGKELSTIATPPCDRQPITTLVCQKEESSLRAALVRELGRGGQAFFIHNDIEQLPSIQLQIQKIMPQVRSAIVHGQMAAAQIEETFLQFRNHQIDLLIATTIVETGIDIPNANTIFIDHADEFGLSDLYQLRGRVGRWNRKAYAYLLYPPKKNLSAIATRRLDAIQSASGYGAGMKVALRDLEIRGCGELLGQQQSGHVATIGFSLYMRLLQRTMQRLQGAKVVEADQLRLEHNLPARIPQEYISSLNLRLEIYGRAAQVTSEQELQALRLEVRERFGVLPSGVEWLFLVSHLRLIAAASHIERLLLRHHDRHLEVQIEKSLGAGRSQRVHLKAQLPLKIEPVQTYLHKCLQELAPGPSAAPTQEKREAAKESGRGDRLIARLDLSAVKQRLGLEPPSSPQ